MFVKSLSMGLGLIGVFWMFLVGGYAVYWYDRRPEGVPKPIVFHVLFFKQTLGLPLSLAAQRDRLQQENLAALTFEKAKSDAIAKITAAAETRASAAEVQIRTVTRTIEKEVPVAISPQIDRSFPLPVGLIRLHNEAAAGDASAAQDHLAAADTDGAPSSVKASQFAAVLVDNYGTCNATAERLKGLQAWVTDTLAAYNAEAPR